MSPAAHEREVLRHVQRLRTLAARERPVEALQQIGEHGHDHDVAQVVPRAHATPGSERHQLVMIVARQGVHLRAVQEPARLELVGALIDGGVSVDGEDVEDEFRVRRELAPRDYAELVRFAAHAEGERGVHPVTVKGRFQQDVDEVRFEFRIFLPPFRLLPVLVHLNHLAYDVYSQCADFLNLRCPALQFGKEAQVGDEVADDDGSKRSK